MGISSNIRTGRHCVFNLHVHLVFVAKYRRRIFRKRHIEAMLEIFTKVCADFDAQLVEMEGERDHVHLLVEYPPKVAVAKLVNSLKGASARRLRNHFPELHRHFYRGALWSPSYFAGSCGGAPIEIVRQYIEQQETPKS